jgi:hypothetical protein
MTTMLLSYWLTFNAGAAVAIFVFGLCRAARDE